MYLYNQALFLDLYWVRIKSFPHFFLEQQILDQL